ncbi:dihydroxyacetone kinase subunit DhaL [Brevibacillus sp. TJ4]|uniref:dihydroxyacetone kinase subunit DhaL n=1 Tax=Brevibacillus sp. TJ4 TaxID=3234853 RepID=UPI0037DD3B6D
MIISVEQIVGWLMKTNERIQANKDYLTELDQLVGDGDHGINMARGFREVASGLASGSHADIGTVLHQAGIVLISKVGGASGPLYGTALMKMGSALKGKQQIGLPELALALQEAIAGIKMRGKAQAGDKTMLDLWEPFAAFVQQSESGLSYERFRALCEEQLEQIKQWEAKRGRASFLGSRSIGHPDPGAVSSFYLFDSLCLTITESGATA